jgi:hypothetical protein
VKNPSAKNPTANKSTVKAPTAKKGDGKMTARPAEPAG